MHWETISPTQELKYFQSHGRDFLKLQANGCLRYSLLIVITMVLFVLWPPGTSPAKVDIHMVP